MPTVAGGRVRRQIVDPQHTYCIAVGVLRDLADGSLTDAGLHRSRPGAVSFAPPWPWKLILLECWTTLWLPRDHSEQCGTRSVNATSGDAALSERVTGAHERMSRYPL